MIALPFQKLFRRPIAARTICVLGMHRSGTSCLTGSLESWGVFLGEVWQKNAHNAKGSRESRGIMDLHDTVLMANGGSWFNPPPTGRWTPEQFAKLRAIVAGFAGSACWGFKDPRTLLVLRGWREVLPNLECIGIFRHPWAVARSLHARDAVRFPDLETGVALWTIYNERLLAAHAAQPFPVLCFDAAPADFFEKLDRVRCHLNFPEPKSPAAFFEEQLRHQSADDERTLPVPAAELLARLKALAW